MNTQGPSGKINQEFTEKILSLEQRCFYKGVKQSFLTFPDSPKITYSTRPIHLPTIYQSNF